MSDISQCPVAGSRLKLALNDIPRIYWLAVLALPAQVDAAEPVAGQGDGMFAAMVMVLLTALVLAALAIAAIVLWSRKLEHTRDMMRFCMKFLLHSEDESERCASAKALGRAHDPGAILVLVDVMWDEQESEAVRKAAGEALHEMSVHFRKHKKIIGELESELEQKNFRAIIDTLIENFEQGKTRYVQSAYLIGRQFMRLNSYLDAREWLTKAEHRNRKYHLYGNRIQNWIQVCNASLLQEADDSFAAENYQQAKERYAALDHGLSDADKQLCASYLRAACVYCKLKDYQHADQALLASLRQNHETDLALTLVPLLQKIVMPDDENLQSTDNLDEIKRAIDERATEVMKTLSARKVWSQ